MYAGASGFTGGRVGTARDLLGGGGIEETWAGTGVGADAGAGVGARA
jgi:hypothetical protein